MIKGIIKDMAKVSIKEMSIEKANKENKKRLSSLESMKKSLFNTAFPTHTKTCKSILNHHI